MGHPVTTHPMVIMIINMTVVFLVLLVLMYFIKLIHYLDPTKSGEEAKPKAVMQVQTPLPTEDVQEAEIPSEIAAVIAASLAAYGYDAGNIRAVRPVENNHWKQSARAWGMHR